MVVLFEDSLSSPLVPDEAPPQTLGQRFSPDWQWHEKAWLVFGRLLMLMLCALAKSRRHDWEEAEILCAMKLLCILD